MTTALPCRYCIANWAETGSRVDPTRPAIVPDVDDCTMTHRDDPRVYDLAAAMARVMQDRNPTDEQISYFLGDADDVVDDFDPTPERWRVRKLPESANDHEQGIEIRLRINDVTYVALEGGKDSRGSVVKLSTFRSW
ncbi:hypothetical protein [Micromonospora carbonacea]|uniref:Uncharacterized protein n=1 Tax=Micromonospora carbonacea TaxID=47853 RepID=A0A1C5A234_9ACTN|nr:hypothetical protein [Micromonospora carbonacea]SCF39283.1 hypothetical protein GA0070563_1112 [Micromonospora carbonacea]